ncbi:MAG: phage holin family protein [Thermomicrobiales bacterium]|nr:phage holin family protein [Thermomicrobiales bacterium]
MIWRAVAYIVAATIAALLVATISQERLLSYDSVLAVAAFALVLGAANAALAPLLGRFVTALGCLPFALGALLVNVALFVAATELSAGVRVTAAGVLVGATIATAASGAVFSAIDERPIGG